jgi:peptide/nickel transport system substrate-binding protein
MRSFLWRAAAALAFAATLVAPADAQRAQNAVRFAWDQVPENVDPYFNNVRVGVIIAHHVWDTLIYRDPTTNEYRGQLATAWRWIDDRTLELDLRRGVTFHNGDAFTADDVVYTLNYVVRPDSRVVTANNVDWIRSAEKVDDHKVRINLARNFPAAIEYLAGPVIIYPGRYHAQVGPDGMNRRPVGSGPFRVVEHQVGRMIRMERNPDYFRDSPKPQPQIARLDIRFIPDRQTQAAELLSGGLDFIMGATPDQARQMRSVPNLQVVAGETMRIVFLNLNTLPEGPNPQLRDPRVREAIALSIGRETMARTLVGEGARVLNVVCYPSQFGCDDSRARRFRYDPARARQLLAEAGHPNGFDIDLFAYREREQSEAMVNYLRAVGIRANLRFMQYAALREQVRANRVALAHQTWGSFSVNDVSASTPVYFKFMPDDINRDPEVRDLLERGDSVTDPTQRREAYAQALALIQERWLSVPLYALSLNYVAARGLQFRTYPDELPRFWEMRWQ